MMQIYQQILLSIAGMLLCVLGYSQSLTFDNSSWVLVKITDLDKNYIYKDQIPYIIDLIRKNKKRTVIQIHTDVKNKQSPDYCSIGVPSAYSFDYKKKTYDLFLNVVYIFPDKCRISTQDYTLFGKAFNSKGSFQMKGDTLVMKANDGLSTLYLKQRK